MSSSVSASSAMLASAHRDVLEAAIPETVEGQAKLVEELKNRARAAVGYKSWKDADLLYSKALEISSDAALHSNLSLVKFNMGLFDDARKEAQQAVQSDGTYVKAFWRLSQALTKLHRTDDAIETIQRGITIEPDNKAFLKELAKLQQQKKEEIDLMEVEPVVDPDVTTTQLNSTTEPAVANQTKKQNKVLNGKNSDSLPTTMTDNEFSKSDHIKGYKIVNGKKTSFFHNEMTDEVKELIGDIAPKRLSVQDVDVAPVESTAIPGASVWNKAGTWEERDVTAWAKESFEKTLKEVSYTFPALAPGAVARVTKAIVEGTASYASVRGKKRYIYEFKVIIHWEVTELPDKASCQGTMTFPDVDGTCELGNGYDMVDFTVKEGVAGVAPLLEQFVKHAGLRDSVHASIDHWVQLFKNTY